MHSNEYDHWDITILMGKRKLFNDPIYGLINFPGDLIYRIIDHPFFQRLRRISQMGLTSLVYPGAVHNRLQHAMGAAYLTHQAVITLISKGVTISDEEHEAVCIATLLHDIGHGPFSHTLEHTIISLHHEDISVVFIDYLNNEFEDALRKSREIYTGEYHRPFFHQLVSGQLDMDRMDYLMRDSYFTGVVEGKIGYDRIISMLDVVDDHLVVEEKGIHSVEKFLMSRQVMYWQVYLHKTGVAAEQMLISLFRRVADLHSMGRIVESCPGISYFMRHDVSLQDMYSDDYKPLNIFASIDDVDMWSDLKRWRNDEDPILSYLSTCLLDRRLFKIIMSDAPINSDLIEEKRLKIGNHLKVNEQLAMYLVLTGLESNQAYTKKIHEIQILSKERDVKPISRIANNLIDTRVIVRHFLCYADYN